MKSLSLSKLQDEQIRHEAATAYPDECCGIIYGVERDSVRIVNSLEPVANVFDEQERYHRFSISGEQLMKAERTAGERNELVLGFYHSHPDHPARPSEYDRTHAWPFYSYVIVAVAKRESKAMTSWQLNDQTKMFDEQMIEITGE